MTKIKAKILHLTALVIAVATLLAACGDRGNITSGDADSVFTTRGVDRFAHSFGFRNKERTYLQGTDRTRIGIEIDYKDPRHHAGWGGGSLPRCCLAGQCLISAGVQPSH